ncbi:MAG: hypothetical protein R3D58_00745 [Saprospiraceae bacterium]
MDIYSNWNFKDNPFNTTSLSADEAGNDLIAGREDEIRKFQRRLYNVPQIVTIEGEFGIGKTSLINVGVFRSTLKYISDRKNPNFSNNPLFVPCDKIFQLNPDVQFSTFLDEVLVDVAQTIIKHKENFKNLGVKLPKNIDEVDIWLNAPSNSSYQGTFGAAIVQLGLGKTTEINTTGGFEKSGLQELVTNWLKLMFPNNNSGGIVCVIDNLELLEKSSVARKIVENMRDTLLVLPGLRWVFCGSLGIVSSILSSPRLEGFLHDPIEVKGIMRTYIKDVLQKRIDKYKINNEYYLPITWGSLMLLYDVLQCNLRNTLKFANDYCIWVADNEMKPIMKDEKEIVFMNWLIDKSMKYKTDIEKSLKNKTFKLFSDAVSVGGSFAFCDFELFAFDNLQNFKNSVKELETVGLVVCVIDENDNRRKSIQVTPKGWFVSHAINLKI